jgi:hypothetical protein
VKYADLIDNANSIVKYDQSFARVYLREKRQLLGKMRDGAASLYIKACHHLVECENSLSS